MMKAVRTISIFLVLLFAWFVWASLRDTRRPDRYLIPDGYIGQVRIEYRVKGAPKLPIENGYFLLKVPDSGRLQTSSVMQDGWASDEYYYVSKKGRREIKFTGWGEGGMIWADSMEPHGANEKFFVGTEQQWRKADGRPGGYSDGPLDPKTLLPLKQKHK